MLAANAPTSREAAIQNASCAAALRALSRSDFACVTTLLGSVVGVNTQAKQVMLDGEEPIAFDVLILATGARHAYFGHDEWEPYAPRLKTLEDATKIRRQILSAFERGARRHDRRTRPGHTAR